MYQAMCQEVSRKT